MPTIAIVSDIHANLEAWEAVLEDIDKAGINTILNAGDTVGYGPNPHECLASVRKRVAASVVGNHDYAVISEAHLRKEASLFNELARAETMQLFEELSPEERAYLGGLPGSIVFPTVMVMSHGSAVPGELFGYVEQNAERRKRNFEYLKEQDRQVLFYGHSHLQSHFEDSSSMPTKVGQLVDENETVSIRINGNTPELIILETEIQRPEYVLRPGMRYLIGACSVGQPRDGNPRACYLQFDGEVVRVRRVEYDVRKTMEKIRERGIPDKFAERLKWGK